MPRPAIEIELGKKFGRLTVLRRAGTVDKHAVWRCLCDCGKQCVVTGASLRTGRTKSCGCWRREMPTVMKTRHGQAAGKRTRAYRAWLAMRTRCLNPKAINYERYGGRGITVCEEWAASFDAFYRDMGDPPSDRHTIERKDNDLGYEPENCRWATADEQRANKRPWRQPRPHLVAYCFGENHPRSKLTEVAVRDIRSGREKRVIYAERYGVSLNTIKAVRAGRLWRHVI